MSPSPKPAADIVAADNEILAIICFAPEQDMDMGIVGIPVVDRNPIKLRAQIPRGVRHQFPGESSEVSHLSSIFRRHRKPEMMPVPLTALGKGLCIGIIGPHVEHAGILSDAKTRKLYADAYERSSALYYASKPSFEEILAEIQKWIDKL